MDGFRLLPVRDVSQVWITIGEGDTVLAEGASGD